MAFREPEDLAKGLLFARVKKQKGWLIIWPPTLNFAAQQRQACPALFQKHLLGNSPEHMRVITSEERGVLFDWESPIVLIRTGDR
jgi:hypothetical protein